MSRSDIQAGRASVTLALKDAGFTKSLRASMDMLKSFGKAGALAGVAIVGAGAAIAGVALKDFMDTGDALDKMRQRTGLSVEALSELEHAAGQSGASLQDVEAGVRKMQKGIDAAAGGSKEMRETFRDLGLSMDSLKKMTPEEQFDAIAKAVGDIKNPTERAAAVMKVFGKSGTNLLPMIEDMDELRQEARDMGFVMSGGAAKSAVKLGDALANVWKTVRFFGMALGEVLAPALLKVVELLQPALTATLKWVQDIGKAISAGEWGTAAEIAMKGVQVAYMKWLDIVASAIGGKVGDFQKQLFGALATGDFEKAWGVAWKGIQDVAVAALNSIIRAWNAMMSKLGSMSGMAMGVFPGLTVSPFSGLKMNELKGTDFGKKDDKGKTKGDRELEDKLNATQGELDAARRRAQYAKQQEEAARATNKFDPMTSKSDIFSTFSAAALQARGRGGSMMKTMEDLQKKTVDELKLVRRAVEDNGVLV